LVILWKETRQLLPIGLLIALLHVFLVSILLEMEGLPTNNPQQHAPARWTLCVIFAGMFAVSAGALLFAAERENRTEHWLVGRGIPPNWVISFKIGIGVVLCAGLTLLLLAIQHIVWGAMDWAFPLHWELLFALPIFFTHAVGWSLHCRRTLSAAALATLTSMFFVSDFDDLLLRKIAGIEPAHSLMMAGVAHLLLLVPVGYQMARQWGADSVALPIQRISRSGSRSTGPLARPEPPRSGWRALAWHEAIRFRYWLPVVLLLVLDLFWPFLNSLAGFGATGWVPLTHGIYQAGTGKGLLGDAGDVSFQFFHAAVVLAAGLTTFMDDPARTGQRFLAHQGVSPFLIWGTKIGLRGGIVLLSMASLWNAYGPPAVSSGFFFQDVTGRLLVRSILLFALSVRLSQLLRTPLLATLVSIFLATGICLIDVALLHFSLRIQILIALAGILLLLFSLWRTRDWLLDHRSWGATLAASASIVLPILIIYLGIPLALIYEAGPRLPESASPPLQLTLAQIETSAAYGRLAHQLQKLSGNFIAKNHEYGVEFHKISRADRIALAAEVELPSLMDELRAITERPLAPWPEQSFRGQERTHPIPVGWFSVYLRGDTERALDESDFTRARANLLTWLRLLEHVCYAPSEPTVSTLLHERGGLFATTIEWVRLARPNRESARELIDHIKKFGSVDPDQYRRWNAVAQTEARRKIAAKEEAVWPSGNRHDTSAILFDIFGRYLQWTGAERARRLTDRVGEYRQSTADLLQPDPFPYGPIPNPYDAETNRILELFRVPSSWLIDPHPLSYPQLAFREQVGFFRPFLVKLSVELWEAEFKSPPPSEGAACWRYLGGIPNDAWTGQPLAQGDPAPSP
jgi:hypothetical protein